MSRKRTQKITFDLEHETYLLSMMQRLINEI